VPTCAVELVYKETTLVLELNVIKDVGVPVIAGVKVI
jgi:hypothetical protein